MQAYLDTNVVIRLAAGDLKSITRKARAAIDRYDLLISPIVRLEVEFLREIGRTKLVPDFVIAILADKLDAQICPISFDWVARSAMQESWTRDAFDRIIVAQARCAGNAYLITADEKIQANYPKSIW